MPTPKPLLPFQAKATLANRFGGLADRLRQLNTKFGLRSRRLFLIWTVFDGEERGEGVQKEFARIELLPTPKITSLNAVQLATYAGGVLATGSITVREVSIGYSEGQLMGRSIPGLPEEITVPQPYDFFYQMIEDGRGSDIPQNNRYRLLGQPFREEGNVGWSLLLERQDEPEAPNGELPFGR